MADVQFLIEKPRKKEIGFELIQCVTDCKPSMDAIQLHLHGLTLPNRSRIHENNSKGEKGSITLKKP